MSRDASFSYVHIDDPNHVLYMERWADAPIPFDDVDTHALVEATSNLFPQFLMEEEDDGGIPINSSTFGAKVYKNKSLLKDWVWSDLAIHDFLKEGPGIPDKTILNSFYSTQSPDDDLQISAFLANGYDRDIQPLQSPDVNSSIVAGDISANSSDLIGPSNNTFNLNLRSNSNSGPANQPLPFQQQTPQVARTRQVSTDKSFQTPIARIVR